MPLIDKLESKFGRLAIPGLIQAVAILQLLTWGLVAISPPDAREPYLAFLSLDRDRVLSGEVWRLLTYIFIPQQVNLIFMLMGIMFLMWIGRGLEQAWGAFRVNVYFVGGMLAHAIAALIFGYSANGLWLFQTLLFAFACFYPNEEILMFFILPVKIKWVAIISAVFTGFIMLLSPFMILPIVFSHLNFLIVFGPDFVRQRLHMAKVTQRRNRFESAQIPQDSFFHQCSVCKKTERDDPTLDFRVSDDGDEICSNCRPKKAVTAGV